MITREDLVEGEVYEGLFLQTGSGQTLMATLVGTSIFFVLWAMNSGTSRSWYFFPVVALFLLILTGFFLLSQKLRSRIRWGSESISKIDGNGKLVWTHQWNEVCSVHCDGVREFYLSSSRGTDSFSLPTGASGSMLAGAIGLRLTETEETEVSRPEFKPFKLYFRLFLAILGVALIVYLAGNASVYIQLQIYCFSVASTLAFFRYFNQRKLVDQQREVEDQLFDRYGVISDEIGRFYRHVWVSSDSRHVVLPDRVK